jgi:hypothetical protein
MLDALKRYAGNLFRSFSLFFRSSYHSQGLTGVEPVDLSELRLGSLGFFLNNHGTVLFDIPDGGEYIISDEKFREIADILINGTNCEVNISSGEITFVVAPENDRLCSISVITPLLFAFRFRQAQKFDVDELKYIGKRLLRLRRDQDDG